MKKILVIALVAALAAAGTGYFIWESGSYVAKVGDQKIKNHEYTFFLRAQKKTTESAAGVTGEQEIKELWSTQVDGEDPIVIVMNQALENAKIFKIQLIQAEKEKFKFSDEEQKEVQQWLDNMLENSENINYVENDLGLTQAQFRDMMIKYNKVTHFSYDFMENNSGVTVTDDEVKAYYDENRNAFDEVTVTRLLISTKQEGLTEEEKREKKKLAEALLNRIQQGEDMKTLVKEYSEDPGSKDNGGTYAFTAAESYDQSFKDWAFQAEPGELEIVETQDGYNVMRLEDKKTFEEKKEFIKSSLEAQKHNEYYYSQLEEWKNHPDFNLVKNENTLNKITQRNFPK